MLAESIVRIGRPIVKSDLSFKDRIRWLTDVDSENCKNYFQNVIVVEIGDDGDAFHKIERGNIVTENKKEVFKVDLSNNVAFPFFYPQGGNPLKAQGIYPLPCYLMYDPHIKDAKNIEVFAEKYLLPRIEKTISYSKWGEEDKKSLAERVAKLLAENSESFISEEKQLGVLMIFDARLPVYFINDDRTLTGGKSLWIAESTLNPGKHLYLSGEESLKGIITARFDEAKSLGSLKNGISTFTNTESEVASIYNKGWLWLSPTWDMARSIYWNSDEWIKGIKVDKESYEAFLYGTQFLKQLQVPISSSILKEMFAPVSSAEAKKHIKSSSYEAIFGIPMLLPLLDSEQSETYKKYSRMLKSETPNPTDLHLEILAGMRECFVPDSSDNYRLTILYYSGDLSRGAMHIRAIIEDVIPSVASEVQKIIEELNQEALEHIQNVFGFERRQVYRLETLPALLGNAYGAGYMWSSLQAILHRQPVKMNRLLKATAKKLNELANKEEFWQMKHELVFFYGFLYFLKYYNQNILGEKKGVKELADWQVFIDAYHKGEISVENLDTPEALGFVTGLLLKQFSNSYYYTSGNEFIKNRVMKFGSKLTPKMVWENGVARCEELSMQRSMKLDANFHKALAQVMLGFIEAHKKDVLSKEKEVFMTAFWSGYLIYKKNEEVINDAN